jgi:spore maturation protein CgeB
MGKALWVLLPHDADWRWSSHLNQSPWYPTARLFRQDRSGGWDNVVADINKSLERYLHKSNAQTLLQAGTENRSLAPYRLSEHPEHRHNVDQSQRLMKSKSRVGKKKINRVLLVSPLVGGSLEVIRYLHTGFLQAGLTSRLLDNSSLYKFYQELDQEVADDQNRTILQNQLLHTLDSRLIACAAEFKPDLVLAVAQSPINNASVAKLRSAGITCAYWFVEDYRFKTYWPNKVPAFDFFFTIQRDDYLRSQFASLGYTNWHYLPLACEPTIHKPWNGDHSENQSYRCQLGFMGSPYRNRMSVFDRLTHYQLAVWGQGWDEYELSPALQASVREGKRRITPEESVKIYSSADIVLNLHSSPFMDGINPDGDFVNPRTFEIAGCGGFQLIDNRKELTELFDPQNEIAVFHNFEELRMTIDYWLARPQLRREMSLKAQARAYRNHTYKHRAETIVEIVEYGPS